MNLREWQARHEFTGEKAAQALGMSRRTFVRYLQKKELPSWLVLACERIDQKAGFK